MNKNRQREELTNFANWYKSLADVEILPEEIEAYLAYGIKNPQHEEDNSDPLEYGP